MKNPLYLTFEHPILHQEIFLSPNHLFNTLEFEEDET